MADSVEGRLPVLVGREFESRGSQTNDLSNWYLLPTLVLDINRIRQGLVSSESGLYDCVSYWVMVPTGLVSQ